MDFIVLTVIVCGMIGVVIQILQQELVQQAELQKQKELEEKEI